MMNVISFDGHMTVVDVCQCMLAWLHFLSIFIHTTVKNSH